MPFSSLLFGHQKMLLSMVQTTGFVMVQSSRLDTVSLTRPVDEAMKC